MPLKATGNTARLSVRHTASANPGKLSAKFGMPLVVTSAKISRLPGLASHYFFAIWA